MARYKPVSVVGEHNFGPDEFEAEFDGPTEQDWVGNGHLELVPRKYRVLVNNYAAGPPDSEIEAAYPVEIESALLAGGVLERVEPKKAPAKKAAAKKTAAKKE